MLKFALKKDRLNFTDGWITPLSAMEEREPDGDLDLLAVLVGDDMENAMDKILEDLSDNNDADGDFELSL
jgi:hypothetical protein